MKNYYIFIIIFIVFSSCTDRKKQDSKINKTNLSNHPYWGLLNPSDITSFDTIKIPLEIDASIFIDDISELETNKSDFNADIKLRLWSSYQENEVLMSNDTINLAP